MRERIIAELDKHELVYQGQSAHLTDAALSAIRPGDDLGNRTMAVQAGSRVKHINRGSTYRVLDAAKRITAQPADDDKSDRARYAGGHIGGQAARHFPQREHRRRKMSGNGNHQSQRILLRVVRSMARFARS